MIVQPRRAASVFARLVQYVYWVLQGRIPFYRVLLRIGSFFFFSK